MKLEHIRYPALSTSGYARSIARKQGWVGLEKQENNWEVLYLVETALKSKHFSVGISPYSVLGTRKQEIEHYLTKGKDVEDEDWHKYKLDCRAWFHVAEYESIKEKIKAKRGFRLPTPYKIKYEEIQHDSQLDYCVVGWDKAEYGLCTEVGCTNSRCSGS